VTVRDNRFDGGARQFGRHSSQRFAQTVDLLSYPSQDAGANWVIGTPQTVTWTVANTNLPPVSTSRVRILLSTNGGLNFPYVLTDDTANDGSETLTLPVATPTSGGIVGSHQGSRKGKCLLQHFPGLQHHCSR
jgi:hypothetical protein